MKSYLQTRIAKLRSDILWAERDINNAERELVPRTKRAHRNGDFPPSDTKWFCRKWLGRYKQYHASEYLDNAICAAKKQVRAMKRNLDDLRFENELEERLGY